MRRLARLVTIVLVLGVLVAEVALRLADGSHCRPIFAIFAARNPFYGWGNAPWSRGRCQGCDGKTVEWRSYAQINGHGLRNDRNIPYQRGDKFRILAIGDSFTLGMQVDAPYTKLLEDRLNREARSGERFEVLNAGVAGWGTDNELLYFVNEGWKYQADLVLLAFNTSNDVSENHNGLLQSIHFYPNKPYFEIEAGGGLAVRNYPLPLAPWPDRLRRYAHLTLNGHSALYRWLAARNLSLAPGVAQASTSPPEAKTLMGQVYRKQYPERWREAWRITRALILRLQSEVTARGSRFAVVVVNGREEVSDLQWKRLLTYNRAMLGYDYDLNKPNHLIVQFLKRRGIPFIPLLDSFRKHFGEDGRPGFYVINNHWTPSGHELAAEEISRALGTLGLLQGVRSK